ncbi:S1C family serine protease [Hydrogenophaga sp.]|uniref:S1C family serine protease n=1 Tax=Hydrogenophaga sp. TaxID=1904254 RepID=UPI003D127608
MSGRCWIAMAGLLASASAWSLEPDALFAKVVPSVWTVRASDAQGRHTSQGSAVVIGPGRLVTNCHVLARMSHFQVTKDNVSYGGKLEFPDPENDLCQIRVDNFHAPAVEMADMDTLRVGARVYAIGTPQGLETTLSDGLLSGLRRDGTGQLMFVQTTTPISPGSSGGGLFDVEGRLIGITTFTRRESQNINFAVPAYRVAEVAERSRRLLEQRNAPRVSSPAIAAPSGPTELTAQRQPGDWFEYEITDHYTQLTQSVNLRVDRVTADTVVFNGGSRVEGMDGKAKGSQAHALVELDMVTPSGGWAPGGQVMKGVRQLKVSASWQNQPASYDLTAAASPEQLLRVGEVEYSAVRIDLQGWHGRVFGLFHINVPYRATVWYAPALNRVIRFNAEFRNSGSASGSTRVNETLELVRAGRN